jgi:hypothetical protein
VDDTVQADQRHDVGLILDYGAEVRAAATQCLVHAREFPHLPADRGQRPGQIRVNLKSLPPKEPDHTRDFSAVGERETYRAAEARPARGLPPDHCGVLPYVCNPLHMATGEYPAREAVPLANGNTAGEHVKGRCVKVRLVPGGRPHKEIGVRVQQP